MAPDVPTLNGEASPGAMEAGVAVSGAEALPIANPFHSIMSKLKYSWLGPGLVPWM